MPRFQVSAQAQSHKALRSRFPAEIILTAMTISPVALVKTPHGARIQAALDGVIRLGEPLRVGFRWLALSFAAWTGGVLVISHGEFLKPSPVARADRSARSSLAMQVGRFVAAR